MVDPEGPPVASATLPSAWGPVHVVASSRGVLVVALRGSPEALGRHLERRLGARLELGREVAHEGAARRLGEAVDALRRAISGEQAALADVHLDWAGVCSWDRRVLEGARTLGRGEVTSYGRLARRIGAPGAARAVGGALGRNPFWLLVPCHRVVAGDGSLGGYGDDPDGREIKRDLLALEGIAVPAMDLVD
ncbi:MAG: methylated-DNA--[protein]-cysteine S-methyltransferase [Candidatus Limnocylindrales bacterium]